MRYLDSFKVFESKEKLNIDEIKENCFIDLIDSGYSVRVLPFYLDSSGRHFVNVDYGIEVSINKIDDTSFRIDDIIDELLYAKEYIVERYNFKLDYIFMNGKYHNTLENNEIKNILVQNVKITFKPVGFLTKAKNYIKSKF